MQISDPAYSHIFEQFVSGPDVLFLDFEHIGDKDLEQLMGVPPYSCNKIHTAGLEDDWEVIAAAHHGYLTRKYVQEAES
jgi:hypothetical protein